MIGIENHASRSIFNDIYYFITTLTTDPKCYLRGVRET